MNYNKTKMPSQNDNDLVKNNPLAESIKTIRSFASLEEDEELMPVSQHEIERSIAVMETVYAKSKLTPFWVAPTRSGSVGLEYRIKDVVVYYHFVRTGVIDFSVARENATSIQIFFTDRDEVPNPLEFI